MKACVTDDVWVARTDWQMRVPLGKRMGMIVEKAVVYVGDVIQETQRV